jgi:hypothetical protein
MADTTTTNLLLTKPEVGASTDTWGTKINTDLDTIDALFDAGPVLKVNRGGTGAATASAARTNLGATTLGANLFTVTNPGAITFPRFNADNSVSALGASDFRTAIGAGTGGGDVTLTGAQTLTNKTIAFADNTLTNVASTNTTQTFTNKTLTSPVITGGTVDGEPIGFRDVPLSGSEKTSSYSLATSDVGKFVQVGSGGSITIPNDTFAAGDVVSIFNNTSGNVTITCTISTAYKAGTDTDQSTVTLQTRGVCTVLFISGTICVISGNLA